MKELRRELTESKFDYEEIEYKLNEAHTKLQAAKATDLEYKNNIAELNLEITDTKQTLKFSMDAELEKEKIIAHLQSEGEKTETRLSHALNSLRDEQARELMQAKHNIDVLIEARNEYRGNAEFLESQIEENDQEKLNDESLMADTKQILEEHVQHLKSTAVALPKIGRYGSDVGDISNAVINSLPYDPILDCKGENTSDVMLDSISYDSILDYRGENTSDVMLDYSDDKQPDCASDIHVDVRDILAKEITKLCGVIEKISTRLDGRPIDTC